VARGLAAVPRCQGIFKASHPRPFGVRESIVHLTVNLGTYPAVRNEP
jgi:hypothetical protein